MKEEVFTVGQRVVAISSFEWYLTEGREYRVVEYIPRLPLERFTFPAYVTVVGDHGKNITVHAWRFRVI